MSARDIEVKPRKSIREEPTIFYINELSYGMQQKNPVRPPSIPTVGMNKIQAKGWKAYFIDYVSSASIHGLNHLAAPGRHIFERLGTVVIIIMSFVALIELSLHFWEEYQNSPTVIVLNHGFHNYKVVRPTIVVCTKDGVDLAKFPSVLKKWGVEDSKEIRSFFEQISRKLFYEFDIPESVSVPSNLWLPILDDLKPDVDYGDMRSEASWIVTDRGFCNSFHGYAAPYSSLDYWNSDNWTIIPQPADQYVYEHLSLAFNIPLHVKKHAVFFSLTHPGNIVDFSRSMYQAKLKWSTNLILNIEELEPAPELRDLSVKQRNCKFRDDTKLTMWPIYTAAMCRSECVQNRLFKFCGCHYHFARPLPGVPTCNADQLRCAQKNKKGILNNLNERAEDCGCLYDCDFVRYTEERFHEFSIGDKTPDEVTMEVKIQFPQDKYIKEQVFGFVDFLAAVGGAAGLLLGASILSFVELFYFATLRCFWYYRKMRSERTRKLRNKSKFARATINLK